MEENKAIIIIPNYDRDEINSDWKKVLESCNKKKKKEIEFFIHKDSGVKKKLILVDGNRVKGVKTIEEVIGNIFHSGGTTTEICHRVFQRFCLEKNNPDEFKNFLKHLASQSKVLVMSGTYPGINNKDIELYHSSIREIFEMFDTKELLEKMADYPGLCEKYKDFESFKFPAAQEGVDYGLYTNGGDFSLLPVMKRLESSFNEGIQAIEKYHDIMRQGDFEKYNSWIATKFM